MKKKRIMTILSGGKSARTITKIVTEQIKNKPFWCRLPIEARLSTLETVVVSIFDLFNVMELCNEVLKKRRVKKCRKISHKN